MNIFTDKEPRVKRSWVELSDIKTEIKSDWLHYPPQISTFPFFSPGFCDTNCTQICNVFDEVVSPISQRFTHSHAFILTTPNSKLLNVMGSEGVITNFGKSGICKGVSFEITFAGINAVSVCQLIGHTVVVRGCEHTLSFFAEWACVCTPILVQGQIVALLDLSFNQLEDVRFAVPLVFQMARDISERITSNAGNQNLENVYIRFAQFGLTSREKEIAHAWLKNQTVPQIAETCSISEHTVKTMIKNIYAKVEVGNKVDFVYKFHDI